MGFFLVIIFGVIASVGLSYLVWGGNSESYQKMSHDRQDLVDKHRVASYDKSGWKIKR